MGNKSGKKQVQVETINDSRSSGQAEFSITNVKTVKILGKGAFGTVSHVLHDDVGYALKKMPKRRFMKENGTDNSYLAWNERNLMLECESKFVLPLEAAMHDDEYLYILCPFYCGGDMLNRLKVIHMSHIPMRSSEVEFYLAQLTLALEHLRENKICHRDIKPDNIFFDEYGNCVLGDLGLATKMTEDVPGKKNRSRHWGRCGSYGYRAPEVVRDQPCGYYSDIYSLGITMYFYAFGGVPWSETKKRLQKEAITGESSLFFPSDTQISKPLCDLLAKMLEANQEERIDIEGIKAHPALKWIDWDKLKAHQQLFDCERYSPFQPAAQPDLATLHKRARKYEKRKSKKSSETDDLPLSTAQQAKFEGFNFLQKLHSPGGISRTSSTVSTSSISSLGSSDGSFSNPPRNSGNLGAVRTPNTTSPSLHGDVVASDIASAAAIALQRNQ